MENKNLIKILEDTEYLRDKEIYSNPEVIFGYKLWSRYKTGEVFKTLSTIEKITNKNIKFNAELNLYKDSKESPLHPDLLLYKDLFESRVVLGKITSTINILENSNKNSIEYREILKGIENKINYEVSGLKRIFKEDFVKDILDNKEELKRKTKEIIKDNGFNENNLKDIDKILIGYRESKSDLQEKSRNLGYFINQKENFDSFAAFAKAFSLYKNTAEYIALQIEQAERPTKRKDNKKKLH